MTLTKRLTLVIVAWVSLMLLVLNGIGLVWFRTRTLNTYRNTLLLELASVWKLAAEMPHLASYNDGWERSALIMPASVRFIDGHGRVTSAVRDDAIPATALALADKVWQPVAQADLHRYVMSESAELVNAQSQQDAPHLAVNTVSLPQMQTWLPEVHFQDRAGR
ncbi:MAG: hypothetical protein K6T83_24025, partial [Alicyclobacillus sp.]|nr:hypothetical protein [Alicyclobacillus sp.]